MQTPSNPDDPLSILTPEELQWYEPWLSKSQMREGILGALARDPNYPPSVICNTLEVMRARVEAGLPPTGDLWPKPSAEETQKAIEELDRRLASYND